MIFLTEIKANVKSDVNNNRYNRYIYIIRAVERLIKYLKNGGWPPPTAASSFMMIFLTSTTRPVPAGCSPGISSHLPRVTKHPCRVDMRGSPGASSVPGWVAPARLDRADGGNGDVGGAEMASLFTASHFGCADGSAVGPQCLRTLTPSSCPDNRAVLPVCISSN